MQINGTDTTIFPPRVPTDFLYIFSTDICRYSITNLIIAITNRWNHLIQFLCIIVFPNSSVFVVRWKFILPKKLNSMEYQRIVIKSVMNLFVILDLNTETIAFVWIALNIFRSNLMAVYTKVHWIYPPAKVCLYLRFIANQKV